MQTRNDWRLTTALFAVTGLVESLAFGHLGAFTPIYLRQLHVPPGSIPAWTGVLSAVGFVLGLPLLPLWGVWADRYGRKLIIIRSSVAGAAMFGLAAVSRDVYWLAAARLLSGFVLGNTGVMMAVQSEITPRQRLGSAVSLISAGAPVGMAVGPYIGGEIVKHVGIRALLGMDAALTVCVALLLAVLLREEARERPLGQSTRQGVVAALRAVAHTPAVSALFGAVFLLAFGISMCQPYVPLLIERMYVGRPADLAPTIGLVLTVSGTVMAVATPAWGPLGDRAGYVRVLRLCAAAVALSLAGQAASHAILPFAGWRAAQGCFQGGIGALAMVLLALYAPPDRRASVLTLSLLPNQLSWFTGPLAGSALAARSVALPFWAGAACMTAGCAATFRLAPPQGTPAGATKDRAAGA